MANKSPLLSIKNSFEKSQESIRKETDFLGLSSNSTITSKLENQTPKNMPILKSVFDSNDNSLNLIEQTQTQINSAKKSSLIDDLFGPRPISTATDRNKFNFNVSPTSSNFKESTTGINNANINNVSSEGGFSLSAPKESRRNRKTSIIPSDPLGLYSTSNSQINETFNIETKLNQSSTDENKFKSKELEKLPEWLGGPKVTKEQKQEILKDSKIEISSREKSIETLEKDNMNQSGLTSKLLSMEFDQQAAIMNMHQHEHELKVATVLSKQTEKLNYLLEAQKIKSSEQEKQFNTLISRQIERQSILEAQIKSQQDRISNYIQTLTAQPTTIPFTNITTSNEIKVKTKGDKDEKEESESLLQKLQLEKLYLENTVGSLKEKHDKEISILEDSHKKQITFLEEAMVQMDKRMQDELECLEADYKHKIQKLKEEIAELEKIHKIEKDILKEDNSTLLQEMHENHVKNLELIKKEHTETIQRITHFKESERKAIEIMTVDGSNIENLLNKSQIIIENLEQLQKNFESKGNNFNESQNNHLLVQEKNMEYLKILLEEQKNLYLKEKQKLMATIQKLELDSSELLKEFKIQNTIFKENQEILKSKEHALLRDREIFIEQTKWERERIQVMRDDWVKEQDKQFEWLLQERQNLIAEKAKFQIFNRLKVGAEDSSKLELEATIKAAQNASLSANQEKIKWQEKINELEKQENFLREKEKTLIQKAKELQVFTQSAIAKRDEGLQALKEAHFIEERYKDKLNKIEAQQEILLQRENKLASEKLDLARERLSFRVSDDVEKSIKDTFCEINNQINDEDLYSLSNLQSNNKNTSHLKDIVDPHLVMLKWDLDNKLDESKKFPYIISH